MWSDITKSIVELLKLAPRYFLAVAVICALLLFTPSKFQTTLGVVGFVNAYRQWIGIAFVCSVAIWVASIAGIIDEQIKAMWYRKKLHARIAKRLENLTEPEKQILRYYFAKNTRGNKLRQESGDVQALVGARIIYLAAPIGSILEGFAHNINDFAWHYITEHPHVLQGTTNTCYTDERPSL